MASEDRPETRAVLLDAGHTLLYAAPSSARLYADAGREIAGFDASIEDYERAMAQVWESCEAELFAPVPAGEVNDEVEHHRWRVFTTRVYRDLGLVDGYAPLTRRLIEIFSSSKTWVPFDDTRPTLAALRARGIRLAIVSNWSRSLRGILEDHDLVAPFDAIVGSCEVGIEKPDPGIFRLALGALGVAPEEAVHVGDSLLADVRGAREAGVRTLLLDRDGRYPDRTDTIRSLSEIAGRI